MAENPPDVPRGVKIAGAWAWNIVIVAAGIAVVVWTLSRIPLIVIPVLVALLISALLAPPVDFLIKHRWPRPLAVVTMMVSLLLIFSGLLWIAIAQLRSGFGEMQRLSIAFWTNFKEWLLESPLHIDQDDLNNLGKQIINTINHDTQAVVSSVLSVGSTATHFLAGLALALFCALFFLLDGDRIWGTTCGLFPHRSRTTIDRSARAGWATVRGFMRVQILVAAIDAAGIGIGALILGMPLALPVAILVFLGSFIPVVGALVTGVLAVFLALIALGPIKALIMVGIVLAVQQIEGHVLQPLIMGSAVSIHPVAVVLAVATGSLVAGIPGALFAVPAVAFINVFIRTAAAGEPPAEPQRAEEAPEPEPA